VRLRFVGQGRIEARGNATGRSYVASDTAREIEVDARDLSGLLQGKSFVIAN